MKYILPLLLFAFIEVGAQATEPEQVCDKADAVTQPSKPAQPSQWRELQMPFEDLRIFDDLPDYVYAMPKPVYRQWVRAQNRAAQRKARREADVFNARNPQLDVYVQENEYETDTDQSQHEEASHTSATLEAQSSTGYKGRTQQTTYRGDLWGGGPVLVLNEYADRPPKLVFNGPFVNVVDPDGVLDSPEKFEEFMSKNGFGPPTDPPPGHVPPMPPDGAGIEYEEGDLIEVIPPHAGGPGLAIEIVPDVPAPPTVPEPQTADPALQQFIENLLNEGATP